MQCAMRRKISAKEKRSVLTKQEWKVLNKIEEWAEKLPYKHLKIEINLKDGTDLVYEKDKQNPIGFNAKVTS